MIQTGSGGQNPNTFQVTRRLMYLLPSLWPGKEAFYPGLTSCSTCPVLGLWICHAHAHTHTTVHTFVQSWRKNPRLMLAWQAYPSSSLSPLTLFLIKSVWFLLSPSGTGLRGTLRVVGDSEPCRCSWVPCWNCTIFSSYQLWVILP